MPEAISTPNLAALSVTSQELGSTFRVKSQELGPII